MYLVQSFCNIISLFVLFYVALCRFVSFCFVLFYFVSFGFVFFVFCFCFLFQESVNPSEDDAFDDAIAAAVDDDLD